MYLWDFRGALTSPTGQAGLDSMFQVMENSSEMGDIHLVFGKS